MISWASFDPRPAHAYILCNAAPTCNRPALRDPGCRPQLPRPDNVWRGVGCPAAVGHQCSAVGARGTNGNGIIPELKLEKKVFARIITFGKAYGCHGAAILGCNDLKDYLINFAKSFIYTTALTPHTLATIITAHNFYKEFGMEEVKRLKANIVYFKKELKTQGLQEHFILSDAPIQSCIIKGVGKAKSVAAKLMEKGFGVKAILSPTVPEGQERLRFCIHSYNSKEELGLVLKLLTKYI